MAKTRRRKKRTHVPAQDASKAGIPRSFVIRRGRFSTIFRDLEKDLRQMMLPHTAKALKESRRNVLKDFVQVAGPLGVTHLMMLSATQNAGYLRVAKAPRGPTLTFRIREYALAREVLAAQQQPRAPKSMWQTPPLVVLNNFAGTEHLKLTALTFQNMFPSINVTTVKLSSCQRVLLLDHDKESGLIRLRQYSILVQPSGVSKNLKALLRRRGLPDLGGCADVADFLTRSGYGSESEGEDAEASRVELGEDMGRGNVAARQSRIRLHEVGPRLTLELVKVEDGLCAGDVLYHAHVEKDPTEAAKLHDKHEERERLRRQRRVQQEENVARKKKEAKRKEELKTEQQQQRKKQRRDADSEAGPASDDDDDAQYYRDEVGEEPEQGTIPRKTRGGPRFGFRPKGSATGSRQRGGGGGGSRGGRGGRGSARQAGRGAGGGRGGGSRGGRGRGGHRGPR